MFAILLGLPEEDLETGEKFVLCGFQRCDSSSLCVESIDGIEYCTCPEGRSGPSCSVMGRSNIELQLNFLVLSLIGQNRLREKSLTR